MRPRKFSVGISPDCPADDPDFHARIKTVCGPIIREQKRGDYQCAIFDYLGREYAAIIKDGTDIHVQDQTSRWHRTPDGGVLLT